MKAEPRPLDTRGHLDASLVGEVWGRVGGRQMRRRDIGERRPLSRAVGLLASRHLLLRANHVVRGRPGHDGARDERLDQQGAIGTRACRGDGRARDARRTGRVASAHHRVRLHPLRS
eukprot:scaffold21612_cov115-Isochrysis_galbana.AAC.9